MEGANEIREIVETDVEGDTGDGARILRQQANRTAQPGAKQILMRSDAEHAIEYAQKIKHAEPRFAGNGV
jgi:hypothetical protein